MPKVVCAYCKKKIDKKDAFVVKGNKRNKYYCCEEHAYAKHPRDILYERLNEVFGKVVTSSILYKEFDELGKLYSYEKILAYIKENYNYLCDVMSKDFVNDYARIRYLAAIFKNSLGDFVIPEKEIKKEYIIDTPVMNNNRSKRKRKQSMNSLMEDILSE